MQGDSLIANKKGKNWGQKPLILHCLYTLVIGPTVLAQSSSEQEGYFKIVL